MAGGSKSESKPVDKTPEAFKRLQQPFADVVSQMLGLERQSFGGNFPGGRQFSPTGGDPSDVLRGIPSPDLPTQAGIAPGEVQALGQLQGAALGTQQGAGISQAVLGQTAAGGFLPGTEGGGNPFLQSAIEAAQRPTLQGLEETLSLTLPGRFTQAGQFVQPEGSSAFDRAAAIATRGVAQELGDIASNLSFAGFESERGRQQEAAQALPQVSAQEVNTLTRNLQAQALPRLIEQAGIEEGTARFNQQMQNLIQTLAISQGITAPVIANQNSSRTKPNVAGTAAQGFSAAFPGGV